MPAVYDNWGRLVGAVLRREEDREIALRTPSDLSLPSSVLGSSSSFNLASFDHSREDSSFRAGGCLAGESFTYNQILKITDSFNTSKLIRNGHSGNLYLGVLQTGIHLVVKKVNLQSFYVKGLYSLPEIEIFGTVNHSRLVPLLGHCLDNPDEKILVYKYMDNKDLSRYLSGRIYIDWTTRLKIATQVAEGLWYLHHQCSPPLVHSWGASRELLLKKKMTVLKGVQGYSYGQCFLVICRSSRSFERRNYGTSDTICAYDVYSFGKVLLELVTGKLAVSDANGLTTKNGMAAILRSIVSVDKKLIADIVDPSLIINDYVLEELMEVALIAKACLSRNPSKRPKMAEILNALEGLFAKKRIINIRQNGKIYLHGSLRIFTLGELNDATKNFGRECWLGRDEFGELYWGSLCEKSKSHGRTVSQILSKRMFPRRMRDIQQRQAEVEVLGRLSHPNILKLLGYCLEDGKLLLLYKFMQEGSLNKYFSGESTAIRELTWEKRLKILIGVARGIAFLHASHKQGFFQQKKEGEGFYGYINCSKIFTDSDHNPMITGFCVAEVDRPYDLVDVHPNAFTRGKYEYAALENKHSGRFSTMSSRLGSDVYGFGVILVRVLTGVDNHQHTSQITVLMRPLEFIERNMDQRLEGKISSKAAVRMVQPAQLCLAYDHTLRPPMEQVVEILEGIEKMANIKTLS